MLFRSHANWHTAVICINPQLSVKEARDFIDWRCSLVSIRDHRDNLICSILNLYIPPTLAERRFFFDTLMSEVPIFSASYDQDPPTFILGDLNTDMTDRTFRGHPLVSPWMNWLHARYSNCFPEGLPTFTSSTNSSTRTTLDYVYILSSEQATIRHQQIHHLLSTWTDHSLLSFDIALDQVDIGSGAWRFNPLLLRGNWFCSLLDQSVITFLSPRI